jgi:hypothetical protein
MHWSAVHLHQVISSNIQIFGKKQQRATAKHSTTMSHHEPMYIFSVIQRIFFV